MKGWVPMFLYLDSLIVLFFAVLSVLASNRAQLTPTTVQDFLALRVTVLNVVFLLIFALFRATFKTRLFGDRRLRGIGSQILYALRRAAVMAAVLLVYLVARKATEPIISVTKDYFCALLLYEMFLLVIARAHNNYSRAGKLKVLILGSGPRASKAWRELRLRRTVDRELIGFVDNRDLSEMAPDIAARYVTDIDGLSNYLLHDVVDELIVAVPLRSCYEMAQRAVAIAESTGVRVFCLNDIYTLSHSAALRRRLEAFIELVPDDETHRLQHALKRAFDFVAASAGLIALAPLLLAIAIAVKATSNGPVFFAQDRYGYRRRRFRMYKFRSMVENAPELMASLEAQNEASGPIFKMKEDPRVTKVGSLLRKTSLDELPQLWNVVLGEMSLVGPRPMSVRDVSLFSEATLMRRFSVQPGITGIWQVSGRSSLTFDQWVALDFQYIEEWSLELDFKILALTVPAVLKRSGAA
jgi:exopolysaccharide biosynthesis polyprenyl glycosylphosphotransferase